MASDKEVEEESRRGERVREGNKYDYGELTKEKDLFCVGTDALYGLLSLAPSVAGVNLTSHSNAPIT